MTSRPPPEARAGHWDQIYRKKDPRDASWFEPRPTPSLELIRSAGLPPGAPILDVGAGTSRLVDELLESGHSRVGVLDISDRALDRVRKRLGPRSKNVEWFCTDVTDFQSAHPWALWHDRAVFHFLVKEEDRRAYRESLLHTLAPGGQAVIATFGPDGPTRCSGLSCRRYHPQELTDFLRPALRLEEHLLHRHRTPSGSTQQFLYARFRRTDGPA